MAKVRGLRYPERSSEFRTDFLRYYIMKKVSYSKEERAKETAAEKIMQITVEAAMAMSKINDSDYGVVP